MRIREIIQIENGVQKKPYADHIYKWRLELSYDNTLSKEEILSFCQTYLKKAVRTKEEYFAEIRRGDLSFDERMKVICGHWYTLEKKEEFGRTWIYTVNEEYID